ncbi:MAG: molybdopterin-dependent oxidoreductase [Thermodesulfobacteriota bacterium]|nr:molybdopterin-dependent oxidoreductase [Thermodesulfobacteriota bacterium]
MKRRIIVPKESEDGYSRRDFLKILQLAGIGVTVGWTGFTASCKDKTDSLKGANELITRCGICGADCGMKAYVKDNRILAVAPWSGDPRTKGFMCDMGLAIPEFVHAPDRIVNPKKRVESDKWVDITWDEALDIISEKLMELKRTTGPESLVCHYGVSQVRSWFYRYFQRRFCNLYGTPNFTGCGSQCAVATMLAKRYSIGNVYPDYENTRCMIQWGCNESVSAFLDWFQRVLPAKEKGARLICIDPRVTPMTRMADIHLKPRPGTDGALALGMMHVIINSNLYDKDFVEKYCIGFAELNNLVKGYKPQIVEIKTGIPTKDIINAAIMYATNRPACITSGNALELHINGVQTIRAVMILQALTGNIDVKGGALIPGKKTPLVDMELKDNKRVVSKGIGMDKYPLLWEERRMVTANILPQAILTNQPYPIKALIVVGGNPILTGPNSSQQREAYKKLDFIVVMDLFMTETAKMADIFLPASSFLERDNLKLGDRIYMTPRVIALQGNAWPEWKFWFELAKKMGYTKEFHWATLDEAIDEHLSSIHVTASYLRKNFLGIEYKAKKEYKKYKRSGFQTPSGKVEFYSQALADASYDPLPTYIKSYEIQTNMKAVAEYPMIMTSGARIPYYFHSQFRNLKLLRVKFPHPLVEINPFDASVLGIEQGDTVILTSPKGRIYAKAAIVKALKPRTVAMSHGWTEANVNELTDDSSLDPISGFPGCRGFLCRLRKA